MSWFKKFRKRCRVAAGVLRSERYVVWSSDDDYLVYDCTLGDLKKVCKEADGLVYLESQELANVAEANRIIGMSNK